MPTEYDAIIVGAGPAGSVAASQMAEKGRRVLLLDRAGFPRDKICGDGLTAGTCTVLEKLGLWDKIEALNPCRIDHIVLTSPNGSLMKSRVPSLPGKRDYGVVLPRRDLDQALFENARDMDRVDVEENFSVKGLVYEGRRVVGVSGVGKNGPAEFAGKCVVGADGAHSLVAGKLGILNRDDRHKCFAVRAYFENVENLGASIEIHYEETVLPGYGWIFPTSEGTANVGVGVAWRFKEKRKSIKELFEMFVTNNRFAKSKLKNANMKEGSFKGWPIPMGAFPGPRGRANAILIGDAASFVDPMTGEGIYFALKSGVYAAQALEKALDPKEPQGSDALCGNYERLWKREFKWREFMPAYALQYVLNKKFFINYSVGKAARNPKRAGLIAGTISHVIPKARLLTAL